MPSEGFVKASSNNLPSVDIFMVTEFIKNDERFNSAEFKGVKATAATRESYGDSAIGYVELKREQSFCILQCKICPEHRVRTKNYAVSLTVDEQREKIVDVICYDCAASEGGCKHALAFLMWVHRRSEDPSPTDVTSYWIKPRLSSVGTSLKFIEARDFGSSKRSASVAVSTFRDDVINLAREKNLDGQIVRCAAELYIDQFDRLSIYKLFLRFYGEGGVNCEDFLSFANAETASQLCIEAEKLTRQQSEAPLWHELRFGRVTASKLHEFAHCTSADGTLIESTIGAYKFRDTKFMKRGRELEKEVLKSVEKKLRCKFVDCGFFIFPLHPVFGASPDALCQEYVVEIKCPSSENALKTYISNGQITKKFKAQVHLQMLCAAKKKGLFCVAAPNFEESKNVNILYIDYDEIFLMELIHKSLQNWKNFVYPKLYKSVI